MRLPGDNEYRNSGLSMKYMMLGVTLCLMLVLGVVILTNKENELKAKKNVQQQQNVVALEHEAGTQTGGTTGTDVAMQNGTSTLNTNTVPMTGAETTGGTVTAEGVEITGVAEDGSVVGFAPQPATDMVVGFNGRKSLQDVERLYEERKLVASDLDFWDMYPVNEPDVFGVVNGTEPKVRASEDEDEVDKEDSEEEKPKDKYAKYDEEMKEKEEKDPSKDGKHTLITYANGEEEWVLINPYLEQNTFDFSKLSVESEEMLVYEDGRKSSYAGVDLSKYNGEVDFAALKAEGIDFVMLRLGSRGYETGQVMLDEKFTDYITKATQAGLGIGVYFYSQAISEAEAVEEANVVIQQLANYQLTYPVAFDMEYVSNDKARIEGLTREEKTTITKAFLETVKNAGYKPMIYGTKEWLIKQIDLTKLTDYDVWLSQQEPTPDYPYQFQMWQYSLDGKLNGVTGDVDMNISFVDYSAK